MKKQLIGILAFIIYLSCSGQNKITTDEPCTEAMASEAKGRWIKNSDLGTVNSKEAYNRLDAVHKLVLDIYPQPSGVDACWLRSVGVSYFGSKRKYYSTNDGTQTFDYLNLPHFLQYFYSSSFFAYRCDYNDNKAINRGYPGETGTFFTVNANTSLGDVASDDTWTINGLPVIMRKPALEKQDGYELSYSEPGRNVQHVLIHRKGMLPYVPVTRKQYLDYCVVYHTKFWDDIIKMTEQRPVRSLEEQEKEKKAKLDKFTNDFANDSKKLKANVDYYLAGYRTDQQIRDDEIGKAKKNKEDELKKFTDELEKTTREGLQDSPAMVLVKYYSSPVFETDPAKGLMLVTENPEYIRKDLPKHVPQLFVVVLTWDDWASQKKVAEVIRQDFSFQTLQAMIDK